MVAQLITPLPSREWLQEHAFRVYKALNLGKVDIEIMRTDDDAVMQVALPDRTTDKGVTPISVFRFKSGPGVRQQIEQAFLAAAAELDRKVLMWSTKH